ncbi:ABC transporter substrate-binding protein [Paenibacillus mendelii]|uniref:ABC transporter substrate-binding protein n=1 Tax=Paenibacillus mendelii TaxID=206163 RepID=A0ABV6J6V8_9BACL|nr:extracellular solute-binding protein [Paenibacillus mendelii]MCQ6561115.1 extracellular solute-binding protein [Paenibacillus mendelii]
MKNKTLKPILMLLLLSMVALSLAACGSGNNKADNESGSKNEAGGNDAAKAVKLKFYAQYSGVEKAVYDAAKESMKKVMPEVEVEFEVAAQDDEQKIKTYAAAGSLPDIFFASSGLIETLKKSDNLYVMDDVVKENNIESLLNETSKPMLWNKDGHSYSVPNVGQWAALIYYNKELFAQHNVKAPTNYTELLEAVKAFKAKDITPLALFAKEKWPGVQLFDMAVVGSEPAGVKKLDNGEGQFSDEAYIQATNKLAELTKEGLLSKNAFNTTADDAAAQFTSGKAAMLLNGAWSMNNIYEMMGDKLGILYTPFSDADKVDQVKWNMSGGGFNQGFAVSKNSANKEVAAKYAALFSIEFAKQRVIMLADPNSILVEDVKPANGLSPVQQQYADDSVNFKTMTAFPWGLENAKFKTAIEDNTQKLLAGQDKEDFIKDMNKAIEQARK